MKTCAIMQPTYLPWAGYFSLIECVDKFIFLDDAQLQRSSWHTRNQILLNKQLAMLTVPTKRTGLQTKLSQALVDDSKNWRKKHIRTLQQAYCRHPVKNIIDVVASVITNEEVNSLASLNIGIINSICKYLDITTPTFLASELSFQDDRTIKLHNICHFFECDTYISPIGAKGYLEEDDFLNNNYDQKLLFHHFNCQPYQQISSDCFVSHLSILDMICNLGAKRTRQYLKYNRLLQGAQDVFKLSTEEK